MLRRYSINATKTWLKFPIKVRDVGFTEIHILDLPRDLVDDFVEFQIHHFVKRELLRQIAGIPYSKEALNETKDIFKDTCTNPLYHNIVCCPAVNGKILPVILATSAMKLFQIESSTYMAKTNEVNRFFQIKRDLNNLCPITKVMKRCGVESAFEQMMAVHQDYGRLGIASELGVMGHRLCEAKNVQMCFSWITSEGTKKVAIKCGWAIEEQIKADEIAKKYNVTLQNPNLYFTLMYRL